MGGPQSHSSMKRKLYLETESKGPWGHHLRSPRVSFHTLEQEITAFISYTRDFKGPEPNSRCKHSTWNPNQYGLTSGYIFPQPREFSVTCIGNCKKSGGRVFERQQSRRRMLLCFQFGLCFSFSSRTLRKRKIQTQSRYRHVSMGHCSGPFLPSTNVC